MRGRTARLRPDLVPLYALAAAVLCAAGGWYLLKELAPLLRPLILAVFLAYTILPAHRALRRRVPAKLAGPLLALLVAAVVLGLAVVIYGNLVDLKSELPLLIERGQGLIERLRTWGRGHLPAWLLDPIPGHGSSRGGDDRAAQGPRLQPGKHRGRFPRRGVRRRVLPCLPAARSPSFSRAGPGGFPPEQADHVLAIIGSINRAMASYLRAKVLSSLVTALPVVAILWSLRCVVPRHVGRPGLRRQFRPLRR